MFNPIALRKAKNIGSLDLSECNRVNAEKDEGIKRLYSGVEWGVGSIALRKGRDWRMGRGCVWRGGEEGIAFYKRGKNF